MSFIKKVEYYSEKLDNLSNIIDKLEKSLNWNRIPDEKKFEYYIKLTDYHTQIFSFTSKLLESNFSNLSDKHILLLDMFNQMDSKTQVKLLQFIETKILNKS